MLEAIGAWPGAGWLRESATAYLVVNAAHILGIGLVLGAILPLDLRLLGMFRRFPLDVLWPFLVRVGAAGLGLASATGLWLFSVKPIEYFENEAFRWKLVLLAFALLNVVLQHLAKRGGVIERSRLTRVGAAASLCLWPLVLLAGRWIGFL